MAHHPPGPLPGPEFRALVDDIRANGLRDRPEVLPENDAGQPVGTLLKGHQRCRTMRELGKQTTQVLVRNDLAGAYAANPGLTVKANFGFVSPYQNGSAVTTGSTEFQFKAGDFKFKSSDHKWLAVSGAWARYRGVGSVNGVGGYDFELTAWDGQASGGGKMDCLRIRIGLANQGSAVVYDNMMGAADSADPGTVLAGGCIVNYRNGWPLLAQGGPGLVPTSGSRTTP